MERTQSHSSEHDGTSRLRSTDAAAAKTEAVRKSLATSGASPSADAQAAGNGSDRGSNRDAPEPQKRPAKVQTVDAPPARPAGPSKSSRIDERLFGPLPAVFADDRDDVLSVIHELEEQLDRHTAVRESLERDISNSTRQVSASSQRAQELEWQTLTLQARIDALEAAGQDVVLLEEEVADANHRTQRLAEQLARSEKENARLKQEIKSTHQQLEEMAALRRERDGLRSDQQNAQGRIEQLEYARQEGLEEREQLAAALEDAQGALQAVRAGRQQLENDIRASQQRYLDAKRLVQAMEQKIEHLRSEKKDLQNQVVRLERESERMAERCQAADNEIVSLRSANRANDSALEELRGAFAEVRGALVDIRSRASRRAVRAGFDGSRSTAEPDRDADLPGDGRAHAGVDQATLVSQGAATGEGASTG